MSWTALTIGNKNTSIIYRYCTIFYLSCKMRAAQVVQTYSSSMQTFSIRKKSDIIRMKKIIRGE